ncbi:MAG: hypothetical protein ACRDYF_03995 [Acidimicrobiia bacterium]
MSVYIGGHFNMLNGNKVTRQHLAALDPATGAVQPWGPSIGGVHGVLDLYITPDYVYVAGEFDNIGNEAIQGIARFTNLGDTPPITTPPTQPPTTPPPTSPPGGGNDPGVVPAGTQRARPRLDPDHVGPGLLHGGQRRRHLRLR